MIKDNRKQFSQILNEVAALVIEDDANNEGYDLKATTKEVIDATHILMKVLLSRAVNTGKLTEENQAGEIGKNIRDLIIKRTGEDPHKFYK